MLRTDAVAWCLMCSVIRDGDYRVVVCLSAAYVNDRQREPDRTELPNNC